MKTSKTKDLLILTAIYLLAYAVGFLCCFRIHNVIFRFFVFDTAATIVTFIFSVILVNSSVYDAYWSLTPMVMVIWLFIEYRAWSLYQIVFLLVFLTWSLRLTLNWVSVFTDFSYEDWRYRKFRDETPGFLWPLVNFIGIHYMPTFLVFLGMLPIFVIADTPIGPRSLMGVAVMLFGILLEYYADADMHTFLRDTSGCDVCRVGLWKYSRHPNYLGEICVWLGVFLAMLPDAPDYWYYGAGFAAIALMFNVISIPLMETRQRGKRPAYNDYCRSTSRLLLLKPRDL